MAQTCGLTSVSDRPDLSVPFRCGRLDVIDLAVELDGDRLGLAQVLVVFGLLRAGELEVGVGQLGDTVALASSSGCDRGVDPALVFPVEGLGADLANLACRAIGRFVALLRFVPRVRQAGVAARLPPGPAVAATRAHPSSDG